MPTVNDKILGTASVVRSAVQGVIKHGDERPGNNDATRSGGQLEFTELKQGGMDKPIFLGLRLRLRKVASRANIGIIDVTVKRAPPQQKSILSFQEDGILFSRAVK